MSHELHRKHLGKYHQRVGTTGRTNQPLQYTITEWEVLRRKPELVFKHVTSMPQRL